MKFKLNDSVMYKINLLLAWLCLIAFVMVTVVLYFNSCEMYREYINSQNMKECIDSGGQYVSGNCIMVSAPALESRGEQ